MPILTVLRPIPRFGYLKEMPCTGVHLLMHRGFSSSARRTIFYLVTPLMFYLRKATLLTFQAVFNSIELAVLAFPALLHRRVRELRLVSSFRQPTQL